MSLSKKQKNLAIVVLVFVGGVAASEIARPYLKKIPVIGQYFA